jgi:hypothetical protein
LWFGLGEQTEATTTADPCGMTNKRTGNSNCKEQLQLQQTTATTTATAMSVLAVVLNVVVGKGILGSG